MNTKTCKRKFPCLGTAATVLTLALVGCEMPFMSNSHDDPMGHDMLMEHGHDMDSLVGVVPAGKVLSKSELVARGKLIFEGICIHCHQADGKGIVDSIPPLLNSDFLMANRKRSIEIVTYGLAGEITVNGLKFNNIMPPITGADENAAAVLTYVRNYFNGATDSIGQVEVMKVRMGM